MDLSELLNGSLGGTLISSISGQLGMDESKTKSTVKAALPEILNGLQSNVQTKDGAASLHHALDTKHDGSLLDNLEEVLSGNLQGLEQDGNGILGHVLGTSKSNVAKAVSQKAGVSSSNAASVMAMLAPVIMAYLGQKKTQKNVNSSGLTDLIGGVFGGGRTSNSSGGMIGMINNLFDKDGDGSAIDDILGMFTKK